MSNKFIYFCFSCSAKKTNTPTVMPQTQDHTEKFLLGFAAIMSIVFISLGIYLLKLNSTLKNADNDDTRDKINKTANKVKIALYTLGSIDLLFVIAYTLRRYNNTNMKQAAHKVMQAVNNNNIEDARIYCKDMMKELGPKVYRQYNDMSTAVDNEKGTKRHLERVYGLMNLCKNTASVIKI